MTEEENKKEQWFMINEKFLTTLLYMAKSYGWTGDYVEIADFVKYCYHRGGKGDIDPHSLEPFDFDPPKEETNLK